MIEAEVQTAAAETAPREGELKSLSLFTVIVILVSVTMTFGAMIAVFLLRSSKEQFWGHIHIPFTLWITTVLLLASSVVLEMARKKLAQNEQHAFYQRTLAATILGCLFLAGQIVAWIQILDSGVVLAQNPHSWFIFLFTGLHGLHIVAGLGGLAWLLARTRRPASGPKYQMHTRAVASGVAVFWHYLDFMWLVLFGLLLFWRP